MSLTSRKLWVYNFGVFFPWKSEIQLTIYLNSGVLLWVVKFPWHKEMNIRLFYHVTGPRKLLSSCYLNKYPLTKVHNPEMHLFFPVFSIFKHLSFSTFKHILNFQHQLKPYCCQQEKSMSPDAFLNEDFISANFVIVNVFSTMGKKISFWRFSQSLLVLSPVIWEKRPRPTSLSRAFR